MYLFVLTIGDFSLAYYSYSFFLLRREAYNLSGEIWETLAFMPKQLLVIKLLILYLFIYLIKYFHLPILPLNYQPFNQFIFIILQVIIHFILESFHKHSINPKMVLQTFMEFHLIKIYFQIISFLKVSILQVIIIMVNHSHLINQFYQQL